MNQHHLNRSLGYVGPQAFQRAQNERLIHSLEPQLGLRFTNRSAASDGISLGQSSSSTSFLRREAGEDVSQEELVAHKAGVNVLAVDQYSGRYLLSGGADSIVRLWDLERRPSSHVPYSHQPAASITRSTPSSHTHALTSLSIYPFDPEPSTILTTSYDKTLKLTSVTPSALRPVHTFPLDFIPFAHSLSAIPSSSPLIAVATSHPAIRLLDLRSGLSVHSLPGHNGAVYSLSWSPHDSHVLASGSADGRVLFFDVRRAHSAFASLDLDDAIGVLSPDHTPNYKGREALDWNTRAHGGPVTSVQWMAGGAGKIVTAGHDQRIRVWDAATGRNELLHFGPRIRNERNGEFGPLLSPPECGGKPLLFWANDDGKGDIFIFDAREGTMLDTLKTPGALRGKYQAMAGSGGRGSAAAVKVTSRGRVNTMAWRINADSGAGIEMFTGHGDGSIWCWAGSPKDEVELEDAQPDENSEDERKRKRKRDLIGDLVRGLTERPVKIP